MVKLSNYEKNELNKAHRNERLVLLDLIKIFCAITIYMGHSINSFSCSYGTAFLDEIILIARSPIMTCFFVVSGFSIYYNNWHINLLDRDNLKQFYIKRAITIVPTYLLIHLLSYIATDTIPRQAIYATPVDFLGLQSMYGGMFGILHNGATWFISSLLLGYFIYPLVQELLHAYQKNAHIIFAVIFFVLVYSEVVMEQVFGTPPSYVSPVFRTIQFAGGVAICNILVQIKNKKFIRSKFLISVFAIAVISILITVFSLYNKMSIDNKLSPAFYFLIFIAMIISFQVRFKWLIKSKLIRYASSLTYYFFILQAFLWKPSKYICNLVGWGNNSGRIIISLTVCVTLSMLIKTLFDRPIKKYLKRKLLKLRI